MNADDMIERQVLKELLALIRELHEQSEAEE